MFVPCLGFEVGNLLLTMRVSGNNGGWVVAPWTMAWVEAADNAIGGCTTVTASLRLQSRDHSGNQRRRPLCCLCQLWWEILRLPGSPWASGVGRLSLFPLIVASRKKQCFPLAQRAWWKYWDTIGNGQWTWSYSSFLEVSQFVSKKSYLILQTYKATVCCFPIMFASTTQQTANAFFVAFPSSAML